MPTSEVRRWHRIGAHGTRKGCFLLESDADRRDWSSAALLRELADLPRGLDPSSGTIFAAAASEWHGAASGGAPTSARRGHSRARALRTRTSASCRRSRPGDRAQGGVLVGVEAPGIFESRDDGDPWSLISTLAGEPGSEGVGRPGEPASRATSGSRRSCSTATTRRTAGRSSRGSASSRRATTARPGRRATAVSARLAREHEDVGFCVHKFVRSPAADPDVPAEPLRHAPHDDAGQPLDRDHGRAAERLRLRRGRAPARQRHFYVVPLDPGHGR